MHGDSHIKVGYGLSVSNTKSCPVKLTHPSAREIDRGIPKNFKCDFKFNSYTFNAGRTIPNGFNLRIFTENGAENTVGERLEGYLKIAINRWRADQENNRITPVSEIRKLMKENEDRSDTPWNKLLKCKKTPQM